MTSSSLTSSFTTSSSVITVELKCEHHRDDFLGIVMRVISGDPDFMPATAIVCVHCSKIAVWIDDGLSEVITRLIK